MRILLTALKAFIIVLICSVFLVSAQDFYIEIEDFEEQFRLPATPVKNQGQSGTCWAFAVTSMLESELLRKQQGEHDLSEMYLVHLNYLDRFSLSKKTKDIGVVSEGNSVETTLDQLNHYGILPQKDYRGFELGYIEHSALGYHERMAAELKKIMRGYLQYPAQSVEAFWYFSYAKTLEQRMGALPELVDNSGRAESYHRFLLERGIQPADYITLRPGREDHYGTYVLTSQRVESSQRQGEIPRQELLCTMKDILSQGYTLTWTGDVGQGSFQYYEGVALGSVEGRTNPDGSPVRSDSYRYINSGDHNTRPDYLVRDEFSDKNQCPAKYQPAAHAMHIVGIARDNKGKDYFITKNSWGAHNILNGYLYMDEDFASTATWSISFNKQGLSNTIAQKIWK